MTSDIHFTQSNEWGVITLNRPDALNALTWDMVTAMRAKLIEWERSPAVKAVLVKGAGEKAFCAGGDIRWLYDNTKKDVAHACEFFREEYRLNALIHHYAKPYVALIDGIVMGGGVGISVHGDFRIVGDRTLFAMPETGIGMFPDVGGGHFLPRLHDGLGLYYALTGARAKAADCMAAGDRDALRAERPDAGDAPRTDGPFLRRSSACGYRSGSRRLCGRSGGGACQRHTPGAEAAFLRPCDVRCFSTHR